MVVGNGKDRGFLLDMGPFLLTQTTAMSMHTAFLTMPAIFHLLEAIRLTIPVRTRVASTPTTFKN